MKESLLRLFNAVYVEKKSIHETNRDILERTIKNGYILDPNILPDENILNVIENTICISGNKANASFHKSWKVVKDSDIETLLIQQIVHYITTYGFEQLGTYDNSTVYIPNEILELPEITGEIPLVVIKAMDSEEILDKILKLGSDIALSKTTINDIMAIIKYMHYKSDFIDNIGNRELKSNLQDFYQIVPDDPTEFLRYTVKKLTKNSLLIKSKSLINEIKNSSYVTLDALLKDAPKDLATIFFRYKPLFLAMKSISKNKTFFNKLRKDAEKMHIPAKTDYLNNVTAQIKNDTLKEGVLQLKLGGYNTFRKIRLSYALNNRLYLRDSIVYRIRNGKGWVANFDNRGYQKDKIQNALNITLKSIANDISKNVKDKLIYIPSNVHYAMPSTEKQFVGSIPSNSYVSVPKDIIVGIHWYDKDSYRVDLDFSALDMNGKYGWDACYRSGTRDILFSGDVTNAPKPWGASELFYMKKAQENAKILSINFYNMNEYNKGAQCKFFVASEDMSKTGFDRNYMVDVNKIIASSNMEMDQNHTTVGLVVSVNGENRVYFYNTSISNSITMRNNLNSQGILDFLLTTCLNNIDLETVLEMAGATIIREKTDEEFIDLSPEALDKTTIINLFQ